MRLVSWSKMVRGSTPLRIRAVTIEGKFLLLPEISPILVATRLSVAVTQALGYAATFPCDGT